MGQKLSQSYYKRRLRANKLRRKVSAKRHSIRVARLFCKLSLIILLILTSVLILKMKSWNINKEKLIRGDFDTVIIMKNHITSRYKILNMIRQTPLNNSKIYKLNTKELEKNIELLESVKNVYIRRFWFPARLVILVEERKPVFVIAPNLENPPISAITQEGVFIGRDYMPLPPDIETVKILSYGVRGDDYENWSKKRVDELLQIIKTVETYSKQKVSYLDLRNPADIYIQLDDVLLRFGEINSSSQKRLEAIATILPQIGDLKNIVKYVDLRWEDAKYIKLKDENELRVRTEKRFGL